MKLMSRKPIERLQKIVSDVHKKSGDEEYADRCIIEYADLMGRQRDRLVEFCREKGFDIETETLAEQRFNKFKVERNKLIPKINNIMKELMEIKKEIDKPSK